MAAVAAYGPGAGGAEGSAGAGAGATVRRREQRAAGAARLFGYLEASDGSGDEYETPLSSEFVGAPPPPAQPYARDKENAAPSALHHAPAAPHAAPPMHHDHCLRY